MLTAKDIMTEEIVVIYEDTLVRQVAHLMLRHRVSSYPVVNKRIGLVGIVTITDLFMIINKAFIKRTDEEFHKRLRMFRDMTARDIMTTNVVLITPDTTLDEIVRLVAKKHIHAFPVVDKKKLVGIISRHDILNAVFSYD